MIKQIVQKNVKTIPEDASIIEAAEKMRKEGIGSLLVERGGKPVGILSDTDIVQKAVGAKKNLEKTMVGSLMISPLPTIQLSRTSHDAIDMMGERGVRHLAVFQGPNMVGLVSIRDIILHFRRNYTEQYSEPKIGVD